MKKRRSLAPESGSPPSSRELAVVMEEPPALPAEDALAGPLGEALAAPNDDERWASLEEAASNEQRPEIVADAYLYALGRDVDASQLGQRAVRFHDEWFDTPDRLIALLDRVLRRDPSASWAFERLVMVLTVAARWDELLAAYDRVLAKTDDKTRRAQLLDEAAHVAKDFAGQGERAIEYLQALLPLRPNDAQLATSLERLLERQGRHRDLIDLWNARLAVLSRDGKLATRARIAACWLDRLNDPPQALEVCATLLAEDPHDTAGSKILERIAVLEGVDADVRRRALGLLKDRYAASKRNADVVRVLEISLQGADGESAAAIHREIVERLRELGRDEVALGHAASLLLLEPAAEDARAMLRELADRTDGHERRAVALAQGADATGDEATKVALLVEAGQVRQDVLSDDAGAADLFARALELASCTGEVRLDVARRLEGLYDKLEKTDERLLVLEALADLEPTPEARREALARAATLSAQRGEIDRALAAWERRLRADALDLEALDAMIELLHASGRFPALVSALRRRIEATSDDGRRRADLVRIASLQERELGAVEEAIATFRTIEETFGPSAESVDALSRLLATAGRWEELATHLETAASQASEPRRRADLLQRLGDVLRESLAALDRAAMRYREALQVEPTHPGARAGLRAILERAGDDALRANAASTLAEAYLKTDDWASLLEIVEHRVAAAADPESKAAVLVEAARLHEERANDPAAALAAMARAFPLTPGDASLELELLRLAEATSSWSVAIDALAAAIAACADDAPRAAALRVQVGSLLEHRLHDLDRALDAFLPVLLVFPQSFEAAEAVVRVGGRVGRWEDAARALVDLARAQQLVEPEIATAFERVADERGAWDAAIAALETAVARADRLDETIVRELETRIGLWHRDKRDDALRAEKALMRAVAADASDAETLRLLAVLQRKHPDASLLDTLLALADVTADDLGVLYEAAQVAVDVLDDRARAIGILDRLLVAAGARWERKPDALPTLPPGSAPARPSQHPGAATDPVRDFSADSFASWAIDRLVVLHADANEHERAVDVLVRGAQLPFDPDSRRKLLHRAGDLASTNLPDPRRAIDLYREILDGDPTDARAIAALSRLYEASGLLAELAELRRHELSLAREVDTRVALRLDLARVLGLCGDVEGQLESLRANLEESPGEQATVARVIEVLEAANRHPELANVLTEQALLLEAAGENARAATLWAKVASLAEDRLGDVPRALASWGRVVALEPTPVAYDALARLHAARQETAAAIEWLQRRLAASQPGERASTVARLAQEHLRGGDRARARQVLYEGLAEEPASRALRDALASMHRDAGEWRELAAVLREGSSYEDDPVVKLEWLREAAEISSHRLDDPSAAVPLFEEAARLAEGIGAPASPGPSRDRVRGIRVDLADALRRADRGDEAKAILDELVEWYGRRRPPERAQVHVQLAHLARARGDVAEALNQLELASSMDMGSAQILRMLGSLAREAGEYARAERAYRALLLIVRRPGVSLDVAIGPSEVLFELHRIAAALGQDDRARENLESAFEAASQNEAEGKRFVQLLRESGNEAFLVRALQARVSVEQDPAAAAATMIELADALDGMGRVDEALQARLDALAHQPDSIPLHAAVRDVARRAGNLEVYEQRLRALAERAQQHGDAANAATFLLRLGEVLEQDLVDHVRAAEAYAQAEATGEQLPSAWRGLARVARARNDRDAELRVLRQIVQVDEQDPALRTDALYRLAELDLASPESRDEGVEMLAWAIDRDLQLERALGLLRSVGEADERVAALHERVARSSGDSELLLEALERVAATPNPPFDALREGAELAAKMEQGARAESLLRRAIGIAREQDALADVTWAMTALAEQRKNAGDAKSAIELLLEAAEVSSPSDAFELRRDAAALAAGPGNDLALAADTYEKLLRRDAGDRRIWEPLLDVHRRLGNRDRLEQIIAETIENVFDASERNVLRLERARLLLDSPGREDDAADALREILDDEPEQHGAAALLADLYERTGRTDDLIELLRRQLDIARDRGELEAVAVTSLRLGALLEKTRREEAIEVYRAASDLLPNDKPLLQAQVRLLRPSDDPALRATAMERLLELESGDVAAAMSLELANVRQSMNDEEGLVRALERGYREAPNNERVRGRLEKALAARGDHARLAEVYLLDARQRKDRRAAIARFREAAKLHLEALGDAKRAAIVLREARELAPDDVALLSEFASARAAGGDPHGAIADLDHFLEEAQPNDAARLQILRVRAELRLGTGDDAGAVEDMETAFAIGGAAVAADLCAVLDRRRKLAADRRDAAAQRASTRRLVEVLSSSGEGERASAVLAEWIARDPNDRDALRSLAAIDAARGDFSGVVDAWSRLVRLEEGEAQAEAALELANAAERCGREEESRKALELALRNVPGDARLRERLRKTYETLGANSELAALTLLDARHTEDENTRFDLLLTAGDLFLRAPGEESRAIEPLAEALELKPFHHEATLLLADALTLGNEIDRAMELLLPAIERHKGRRSRELAALQHRMARAANAGGGRDVELQWLTKALECDMQNGQVAAELAEVAIELRQFDIALKALKAVTLLRTPGPMSRALATLRQGQIAYQQGDAKRAALLAKKALAEEPTLSEAEEFLRELGA